MGGYRTESRKVGGEAGRLNLGAAPQRPRALEARSSERSQRNAARPHGSRDPRRREDLAPMGGRHYSRCAVDIHTDVPARRDLRVTRVDPNPDRDLGAAGPGRSCHATLELHSGRHSASSLRKNREDLVTAGVDHPTALTQADLADNAAKLSHRGDRRTARA